MNLKFFVIISCLLFSSIIAQGMNDDDDEIDDPNMYEEMSHRTAPAKIPYSALIRTELGITITFTIPHTTDKSWTFSEIANSYYGNRNYWPLLRAANPQLLRKIVPKDSTFLPDLTLIPANSVIILPSLLTCTEFLPLTCITRSVEQLKYPISYLGLINLDLQTEQMNFYLKSMGMIMNLAAFNALSTLQMTHAWITNVKQSLFHTTNLFTQPDIAFSMQAYHLYDETITSVNLTIINEGNLDFANFRIYQPSGFGQSNIPPTLKAHGGSVSILSTENDDFGGTSGFIFASVMDAQASPDFAGLVIRWDVKNSEIFPNQIIIDTMPFSEEKSLAQKYNESLWNIKHMIDDTITGNTIPLSHYGYQATVQISQSRVCHIIITLSENNSGVLYSSPKNYNILLYPYPLIETQGLWQEIAEGNKIFTGIMQYRLSDYPNRRHPQWRFYQVKANVYNIRNLCSGTFIKADTSLNLVSYTLNRTGSIDIQWNIVYIPKKIQSDIQYVIFQSLSIEGQCLTASPEYDGRIEGAYAMPVYLSDCSFAENDQKFEIRETVNGWGSESVNCPLTTQYLQ